MFLDSWERDLFDGEPRKSISAKQNQISVEKLSKVFQNNSKQNQNNIFENFVILRSTQREAHLAKHTSRSTPREAHNAQHVFWCGSLT